MDDNNDDNLAATFGQSKPLGLALNLDSIAK